MFRGRGGKPQPAGGIELPENIQLSFSKDELPLYPSYQNFSTSSQIQLSSQEILQVQLGLQYLKDMNGSAYYLEASKPKPEIQRYSDKFNVQIQRPPLSSIQTDLSFFPAELQTIKDSKKRAIKKKKITMDKSVNLEDLEKLEKLESTKDKKETEEEDMEEEEDVEYDDEIEEEEGDYLVNHYDDELDMVGDSDGEQDY